MHALLANCFVRGRSLVGSTFGRLADACLWCADRIDPLRRQRLVDAVLERIAADDHAHEPRYSPTLTEIVCADIAAKFDVAVLLPPGVCEHPRGVSLRHDGRRH